MKKLSITNTEMKMIRNVYHVRGLEEHFIKANA